MGLQKGIKTGEKYRRHNRGVKKSNGSLSEKLSRKGNLNLHFLQQFELMYQWAEAAVCELERVGIMNNCIRKR